MKPFLRRLAVNLGRPALTLLIVAAALVAGRGLWAYYQEAPWTRDGRVRADVVTIAPDVPGLVTAGDGAGQPDGEARRRAVSHRP